MTPRSPTTLDLVAAESSSTKASAGDPAVTTTPARYRCGACGNLTRFDVIASRRTRAFHHYSVGGELKIEDVEVLDESVEEVSCRWCGHGDAIEVLDDGSPPGS